MLGWGWGQMSYRHLRGTFAMTNVYRDARMRWKRVPICARLYVHAMETVTTLTETHCIQFPLTLLYCDNLSDN